MSPREMELLAAISQAGSVTAAALATGMSQPAASAMLRRVETRLGFELFARKRQRLELTASGRGLLAEVTHALAALESVERLAESMGRKRPGRLVIGTISAAGAILLPPAIHRFQADHPRVPVVLRSGTAVEVVDWAASQRVDVGIILGGASHEHVGSTCLSELTLVCAMPPTHPLAGQAVITVQQLASVPYIAHSRHLPLGVLTATALERETLPFRPAVEVAQFSAACALAEAGCGIAVLDTLTAVFAQRQGLVVRPLQTPDRVALTQVWAASRGLGALAATLTRHLKDPATWQPQPTA